MGMGRRKEAAECGAAGSVRVMRTAGQAMER